PAMTVTYSVEARDLSDGIPSNYRTSHYPGTATITYVAEDSSNGTNLGGALIIDESAWIAGRWTVDTTSAAFARKNHPTLPPPATVVDGPFSSLQLGLDINDVDDRPLEGVNMNPGTADDCELNNTCTAITLGSPR